jgi:predicted DNA-binding transcriptional regulator YafY
MMRADRLLSIMLLLQTHRRMTARALAERLEVSERTIYRDIEALSVAGVPVSAERGKGGGCTLLEGYRTNLTGLNEAEIQTLFLTQPAHLLGDLGLRQASEAALIKLLAALPPPARRDAEYARQRFHVDTAGWRQSADPLPCLPTVQEAVWQERKLRFTYARADGGTVERLVDPLGLVAKGNMWYLIGMADETIRTYRVARIRAATVTDEPCIRPPDFDLAAYWAASSATFVANLPRYPVTLRVSPGVLPSVTGAGAYGRIEANGPTDPEGWSTLHMVFDAEDEACGYIFRFGTQVEILAPEALRDRVARTAMALAAFYHAQDGFHAVAQPAP